MRSGPDATLSTAEIGKTFLVVNTQNDKPTPSAVEELLSARKQKKKKKKKKGKGKGKMRNKKLGHGISLPMSNVIISYDDMPWSLVAMPGKGNVRRLLVGCLRT